MSKAKYIAGMVNSSGDVTNTSLTNSLDLKAPLASPTFTGTVSGITKSMVGLGNVDNTTDLLKPISTATQTALNLKANQSTTYTKTEADAAISNLVAAAPGALDTLNELATALGNDPNFATTVTNSIALKSPLASPTLTGTTTAANLAYTGTLTGSTGILNIGSGQLYKDASGNVGIGTSSPSSYGKLSISQPTLVNTSTIREVFIDAQANTATNTAGALSGITFRFNTTSYTSQFNKTSGIYGINTDSGAGGLYGRSAGLVFYTSAVDAVATEAMRIDSSGNVGIGTSNPYSQLDVYSGITSSTTGEASGVGSIRITNGASVLTSAGGLEFKNAGDSNGYGSKIQALNSGGSQLVFANRNASATWIERMRIDSSGNLLVGTTSASVPSTTGFVSSANTFGFKNRIINGNFSIWQRGTTITGVTTAPTPVQYTADRWYSSNYYNGGGAVIVVSKNTDGLQAVWSGTPTTTGRLRIGQAIESLNCKDLWGSPITITVVVKAVGGINRAGFDIGSNTTDVSFPAGSTVTASSPPVTINSSTFTTITLTTTLPSAPSTTASLGLLIWVDKSSGTDASGDGLIIQSVQLEKGSVATSFDYRPYGTELALCQRYYQRQDYSAALGSAGATAFTATKYSTTDAIIANIQLATTMRTSPTISFSNAGPRCIFNTGNGSSGTYTASTYSTAAGPVCVSISYNALAAGYGWIDMVGVFQASAEL